MSLFFKEIEKLNSIDGNWREIVRDETTNDKEPSNQELVRQFNELWKSIRRNMKNNFSDTVNAVKEEIMDDCDWLIKDVRASLNVYFDVEPLRKMQDNSDKSLEIVKYLFDNVIIFYDPQFIKEFIKFGFDTPKDFCNIAQALDGLIGFYIRRHYNIQAIKVDLEEETGFAEYLCEYICNVIKENYNTLQLNLLLDMQDN